MPRPTDHYTHAQFEPIDSDFRGETVRCIHCKNWSGSVKTLSRKKEHLLKCPSYATWRAAGNGQDLAPPNKYQKRDSATMNDADPYSSPYTEYTPTMARSRTLDISRFFDEFWDDTSAQKVCEEILYMITYMWPPDEAAVRFLKILIKWRVPDAVSKIQETLPPSSYFMCVPDSMRVLQDLHDTNICSFYNQCMRARCRYCGFSRAKNSTRQFEHMQQCNEFLNSNEGQQAVADGLLTMQPPPPEGQGSASSGRGDIFRGRAPNPTFNRPSGKASNIAPAGPGPALKAAPSLVNHLLTKNRTSLDQATQLSFLSHAGCGTLSSAALQQWLSQQGHMSRALCTFIGGLIYKVRLTDAPNPANDTSWRALDLLVSALNNAKRELEFLRTTHIKYLLQHEAESAKPATKGFLDLFASVSSPSSSLLEGLVVLWIVEYLYCVSWQYAANFIQPAAPSSTSYTIPSYLQPGQYDMSNTYGQTQTNGNAGNGHTTALHEALIPNWTSTGFTKFVDACKSIVDELANAQTTGNGATELSNCETNFKQAVWLWKQVFPEVTGMGEEDETVDDVEETSQTNGNGDRGDGRIEIPDDEDAGRDEDAPSADSPYGGTGLQAVAAANRTV